MEKAEKKWMIYGANGYTGQLLVEEAVQKNHKPIVAGRNPSEIKEIAQKYRLEFRIFSLEDNSVIEKNIEDLFLVLNAAGPFSKTAEPFVNACLTKKVHYLDITGEISVFEHNFSLDKQAKENKIALISGVGFDVIPSDCLINHVNSKIENGNKIELAVLALSNYSPGTMKTLVENISHGSVHRKDHQIVNIKMGKNCKSIPFLDKERTLCPVSWGDISTGYWSTKIPNIIVYMPLPKNLRRVLKYFGWFIRWIFKKKWVQKVAKKWVENNIHGPNNELRESGTSHLWCRIENIEGLTSEAWLETIEAYKLTSITGILCVEKLIKSQGNIIGALTPAQAFDYEFVLEIPKTKIIDK